MEQELSRYCLRFQIIHNKNIYFEESESDQQVSMQNFLYNN